MSFIRPEIRDRIHRHREILAGIAALGAGLWIARDPISAPWIVGIGLIVAGAGLIYAGIQQARFRGRQDGPGVVDLVEGQLSYYGPVSGGMVSLSEIRELALRRLPGDRPHWQLTTAEGTRLDIPVDAAGADRLFDAFTALPGLEIAQVLAALRQPGAGTDRLWQRRDRPEAAAPPRLH